MNKRERGNANKRRERALHPERSLYGAARRRAMQKGLEFSITAGDIESLFRKGWVCEYCDTPIGSYHGHLRPNSVTLDRIIPSKGYTLDNIALACHRCNAVKNEHTPESLRYWLDKIESLIQRRQRDTEEHLL